jgi:hypothetical protein
MNVLEALPSSLSLGFIRGIRTCCITFLVSGCQETLQHHKRVGPVRCTRVVMRCVTHKSELFLDEDSRMYREQGFRTFWAIEVTIEARKPMAVGLGNYANSANIC